MEAAAAVAIFQCSQNFWVMAFWKVSTLILQQTLQSEIDCELGMCRPCTKKLSDGK